MKDRYANIANDNMILIHNIVYINLTIKRYINYDIVYLYRYYEN